MASQWPPKKNTAFTLYFTLYKNDGTVIANPGTYTKKVSIDGAAVADIAASVTECNTTYGQCSVVLAAGEMNGDAVWVQIKDDTSGCIPFTVTIYTAANLMDDIKTDSAAIKVQTDKMAFTVANQIDANTLKVGGTTQTGRDIGASVLLSSGTGAGQLDFTSGVVKSNMVQILASAIAGTAAQISAAFTKFFDKASPTGTINSLPDAVPDAAGGLPVTGNRLTSIPTIATVTTVTNLTNAPTAGDFTAAMKTSLNAATPASVQNIPATGSGFTALGDTRIANLDAAVSTRLAPAGTLARVTLTDTCTTNTDMLTAATVWSATNSTLSLAYSELVSRMYRFLMNKINITDATGALVLRNEADGANLATQTVTDNDTTTIRTALTWL